MESGNTNINVLWIDDEWEKQKDFIGEAEQLGINIKAAESHVEGMEFLDANPNFYHAVILDAKVKFKKDSPKADLSGLRASYDRMIGGRKSPTYLRSIGTDR